MTGRDAAFMRGQLASVGILLEPSAAPSTPAAPATADAVDRDEVRAILIAAGAPARDLEWLVRSCPSIEDARAYRPPHSIAYCARCGGPRAVDPQLGCIECATSEASP
jgi:hypothetical protein